MPLIKPDLSETSGVKEPGTYQAKIVSADPGVSGAGNPKIILKMAMQYEGKEVNYTAHVPTAGKGAFVFENLLRATHFDDVANALRRREDVAFDTDNLIGQELLVVIENTEQDGQTRDQVKTYLKA